MAEAFTTFLKYFFSNIIYLVYITVQLLSNISLENIEMNKISGNLNNLDIRDEIFLFWNNNKIINPIA